MKKVLITGAAGNLGGLLAEYLKGSGLHLNLLTHKKDVKDSLKSHSDISIYKADLSVKDSLGPALEDTDVVVHFAGVLFKHNPEKFLLVTNTVYFKNLLEKAVEKKVKRIILISFPHVEGETTPENPATGKLNGNPGSVHAKTRLQEEILMFDMAKIHGFEAVSLRVGMVYGRGILMIDGARWFAEHGILGIWRKPTWIHLISTQDFLEATKQAVIKENIKGIYHLGDEGKQTLQEFLDTATKKWGFHKPVRMNIKIIFAVAWLFEMFSLLFGTKSPLTRDFIRIGMVSYYSDTTRMRSELLKDLKYRTYKDGLDTL